MTKPKVQTTHCLPSEGDRDMWKLKFLFLLLPLINLSEYTKYPFFNFDLITTLYLPFFKFFIVFKWEAKTPSLLII